MQVRESSQVSKAHGEEKAITDGMLVTRTLSGDQSAFELLVQRYNTPLFNFICHLLGDYDLACDVAQQVFLQLYISMPTLRTSEPLKAWLFQVARNRCLDELRRKRSIHFLNLKVMARMTIFHRWISCLTHSLSPMRWLSAAICGLHYTKQLMRCQ